jgi:hypothetical protein
VKGKVGGYLVLARPLRLASSLLLILAVPTVVAAAGLEAGAARVDITPVPGLGMYGFASRKGGATGVRCPLMVRVLVLDVGEKPLALVAMDLGKPPAGEWIRGLRQNAARRNFLFELSATRLAASKGRPGWRVWHRLPGSGEGQLAPGPWVK